MAAVAFPGEKYLLEELPDYDNERQMLVVKVILTFLLWTIIMPFFLASERHVAAGDESQSDDTSTGKAVNIIKNATNASKTSSETRTITTTTIMKAQQQKTKTRSTTAKKPSRSSKKNDFTKDKNDTPCLARATAINSSDSNEVVRVVDGHTNLFCCVGFIFHAIYVLLKASPDNYYTTRTVFETPLFTHGECNHLVDMAERVARKNYQMARKVVQTDSNGVERGTNSSMMGYLKEPFGWQKTRHQFHPTTDLNLVTDNFSDEDRAWIQQRLDARLAPTLERIFGVPPSAIRANDMFIVRYDGDRQASLSRHTDDGSITFSVLLSHGFEGGGTRYWNRVALDHSDNLGAPFTYVLPKAGMMTTFPAMIEHEGVQTTKGRRYLLIGFLAVDKIDPWTHRSTDLSWFSSWGSFNWASTKFKEGAKSAWMDVNGEQSDTSQILNSNQAREIFGIVHKILVGICDVMFTHRFAVLVNETSADDFLLDLDEAHELKVKSASSNYLGGSWFSGQQISVNIDGSFRSNRKARQDANDKFERLQ